jgi:hypothetical protein
MAVKAVKTRNTGRRSKTAATSARATSTATKSAKKKRAGDVLGLSGSRPPKPARPVKAAGTKRRPKGIEIDTDGTQSQLPQARVRL